MTAYEMRISDWSSDVCSSDLSFNDYDFSQHDLDAPFPAVKEEWLSSSQGNVKTVLAAVEQDKLTLRETALRFGKPMDSFEGSPEEVADQLQDWFESGAVDGRSEEHTSELQSLMRNSYAVFCLNKNTHN